MALAPNNVARVYEIDPLQDNRWSQFLDRHPTATLFHSKEWLTALRRTYGYRASVLTTASPGADLANGLVFCRVQSWLTGRRLVSVPFSDHCTPLIDGGRNFSCLLSHLQSEVAEAKEKYLEIRAITGAASRAAGLTVSKTFCLHRLDLRPSLNDLFQGLHANCVRRKIARAQRERVTYEDGTSEELLRKYYQMAVLTRRRHQIPPQPVSWFRNLLSCFGERAKIRVAFHEGQPAAGVLTIRYKNNLTYKYGCSNPMFHRFGPMQLLLWRSIQEAKEDGLVEFDMGRTDWRNAGLLTFKDRWGAARSTLQYFRDPVPNSHPATADIPMRIAKRISAWAPDSFWCAAGNLLYRHIA